MNTFLYILMIWNLLVCTVFGIDKQKAKQKKWRIPEASLLWLALLGGGVGAFFGMRIFHHKTKKPKFYLLVPLFAVLQIILIAYIVYQKGDRVS